ncbi:hypothetical protein RRG08_061871 [Elysia crispata]|uniref:Uncharacterized protein n=1 Tax=Elysia crispata TaxID=231223 RepID=A0AAE1CIL8_9GAST|nr:hypothetical protein RRG08_061871 [Elysia crispata]
MVHEKYRKWLLDSPDCLSISAVHLHQLTTPSFRCGFCELHLQTTLLCLGYIGVGWENRMFVQRLSSDRASHCHYVVGNAARCPSRRVALATRAWSLPQLRRRQHQR